MMLSPMVSQTTMFWRPATTWTLTLFATRKAIMGTTLRWSWWTLMRSKSLMKSNVYLKWQGKQCIWRLMLASQDSDIIKSEKLSRTMLSLMGIMSTKSSAVTGLRIICTCLHWFTIVWLEMQAKLRWFQVWHSLLNPFLWCLIKWTTCNSKITGLIKYQVTLHVNGNTSF